MLASHTGRVVYRCKFLVTRNFGYSRGSNGGVCAVSVKIIILFTCIGGFT